MSLQNTPRAERLHIAFFGKRNSGKSSLINAITNQQTALVSHIPGTTTDPVYKAMEIAPLGPCVLIDTAGFDDEGQLGELRVQKTREVFEKTDIAVMVFSDPDIRQETEWLCRLKEKNIPVLGVVNKTDLLPDAPALCQKIKDELRLEPLTVSAKTGKNISLLPEALSACMPEPFGAKSFTGHLVEEDDVVLLVMPQDIQAPKGRLILPQVQTIRDLLDHKCMVISVTTDKLSLALRKLKAPPKLIITDSQIFGEVYAKKPAESLLTSFSVLLAGYKGDMKAYLEGAQVIETLNANSRVLIAEACTHKPMQEDIGRVQIPRILKKKFGETIGIDIVAGGDFPKDLTPYDLVIQCGGCMFNQRYMLSRIAQAQKQKVPITNYGIFLAQINGILDKIETGL